MALIPINRWYYPHNQHQGEKTAHQSQIQQVGQGNPHPAANNIWEKCTFSLWYKFGYFSQTALYFMST